MRRAQQADPSQNERNERRVNQEEIRSGNNSDNENESNNEGENANDKKVKKKRVVNRLTFKQDHLMDSTKGLRSLYEWVNKLKLETFDNKKEVELLNQYLRLYKEWHFNLMPRFDIKFFIQKCHQFGREGPTKSYLAKMRSVHMGINQWEDFEPEAEEEQTGQNTQNIDQTQSQMTQTQTQNSRLNFQRAQNNLTNNNPRPQQPNRTQSTNTTQNTTQSNLNNNGRFAINNKNENTPKKAQNNNQIRSHVNNSLNRDSSTQGRTESIPQSTQEIPMVTEKDIANKRREQSYQATLQVHEEYDDYMEIETRDAGEYGEDPFMEDYFDENPEDFDNGKEDEPDLGPDPDDEEQLTEQDLEYRIKKFKTS